MRFLFYPSRAIFVGVKFRVNECFTLVPEIRVCSCEIVGHAIRNCSRNPDQNLAEPSLRTPVLGGVVGPVLSQTYIGKCRFLEESSGFSMIKDVVKLLASFY